MPLLKASPHPGIAATVWAFLLPAHVALVLASPFSLLLHFLKSYQFKA
jgi:hypothetical protein